MPDRCPSFLSCWFAGPTWTRALRVAGIVGTLLLAINQGEVILAGVAPPLWKVALTYFVPYAVSSWSSVAAMRDQDTIGREGH